MKVFSLLAGILIREARAAKCFSNDTMRWEKAMKTWEEAYDGILLFPFNLYLKSFQNGFYFLIAFNSQADMPTKSNSTAKFRRTIIRMMS